MTDRERELSKRLHKARQAIIEAVEWCPEYYGIKSQLEEAFTKIENAYVWYETTHK
jgi:hypothetical protein